MALTMPELIYCANGNARYAEIAIKAGYTYGAQLPGTVYHDIEFADQNWKRPNLDSYVTAIKQYKPRIATVKDLECANWIDETLAWAESVAPYVDTIIIIPKAFGVIGKLPNRIGGRNIVMGYSVPTRHGATSVPAWEFSGRDVHLLGGSPHKQIQLFRSLSAYCSIVSIDGNMHNKLANSHCMFWVDGTAKYAKDRHWPTMREFNNGELWPHKGANYEAFAMSCQNIKDAWLQVAGGTS